MCIIKESQLKISTMILILSKAPRAFIKNKIKYRKTKVKYIIVVDFDYCTADVPPIPKDIYPDDPANLRHLV